MIEMKPDDVRSAWPEAYGAAQGLRTSGRSAISIIEMIISDYGLSHEAAKRILVAIDSNTSLETQQHGLLKDLQKAKRLGCLESDQRKPNA